MASSLIYMFLKVRRNLKMVKEHISEIFGKDSLYFDIKPELSLRLG